MRVHGAMLNDVERGRRDVAAMEFARWWPSRPGEGSATKDVLFLGPKIMMPTTTSLAPLAAGSSPDESERPRKVCDRVMCSEKVPRAHGNGVRGDVSRLCVAAPFTRHLQEAVHESRDRKFPI